MSYRGLQATFPAGLGGFNSNDNVHRIPPTDLVRADNIRFDGDMWKKAPGLAKFDSNGIAGTPDIFGATAYVPAANIQRIITAANDGKVYRSDGTDLDDTTLVSSLTFTDPVVFIEAGQQTAATNKKLLMFSKSVEPHVLDGDGTSMTALTNVPSDWSGSNQPAAATYHDGRIYAWGNQNFEHALYVSNLLDHTDFSTNDPPVISVEPGFSTRIVAAFSFLPQKLYVWKFPVGIYRVDTTNITGLFTPIDVLKRDLGGAGPRAVTRVKNDVWFISQNGHIHSLTIAENSEDTSDSDLTAQLNLERWLTDHVDLDKLDHSILHYDEVRQEVWAIYTSKTGTFNDIGIIIDISIPERPRAAIETGRGELFETIFPYQESSGDFGVYVGGEGGHIYKANQASRDIDGAAYTAELEYAESDLAFVNNAVAGRQKRFDWLELLIQPTGNYDLSVTLIIDGIEQAAQTINLGSTAGTLDSFVLDTDRLGGTEGVPHKIKLTGSGRRIGMRFTNSGASEDFSIQQVLLHFTPLGHKGLL